MLEITKKNHRLIDWKEINVKRLKGQVENLVRMYVTTTVECVKVNKYPKSMLLQCLNSHEKVRVC